MKRFVASIFTAVLICSTSSSASLITSNLSGDGGIGNFNHIRAQLLRINLASHQFPGSGDISSVIDKTDDNCNWIIKPDIFYRGMPDQKTPKFRNNLFVVSRSHHDISDYFQIKNGTVNGYTGNNTISHVVNWSDCVSHATKIKTALKIDIDNFSKFRDGNKWISTDFDPDCYFPTNGIRIERTTEKNSVPEPSMLSLIALGFLCIPFIRQKQKQHR